MRRGLVGTLITLLVLAVAGCGGGPRGEAQRLADELFPGQLEVVDTITESGGPTPRADPTVVFRVRDDPDAAVVIEAVTPDALRSAYDRSRWEAGQYRALRDALVGQGLELAALRLPEPDQDTATFWVVAELTNANVTDGQRRLDRAVAAWASGPDRPERLPALALGIVAPAAVSALPPPDPSWPTVFQRSNLRWVDEVRSQEVLRIRLDAGDDGYARVGDRMLPVLSEADESRLRSAAKVLALGHLFDTNPGLTALDVNVPATRLVPGTIDRLRTYVFVCPSSDVLDCPADPTYQLALTINPDSLEAMNYRLLRRPARGWSVPVESMTAR